jgi:DNA-3-methyladenine glycosylase
MGLLPKSFYLREDVVQISKELLGKFLVTQINGQKTSGKIVETEAYRGPEDKASHAWNNRRTSRTDVMFWEGGVAYIYLCYGMHHLFNIVTGEKGLPHAILIRAVEPVDNLQLMLDRRKMNKVARQLTAGPGVLSQAFGLSTKFNGAKLTISNGPVWIEDRGIQVTDEVIIAGPRVGVQYAGESALWNWRFRIKDSPWTSKPD